MQPGGLQFQQPPSAFAPAQAGPAEDGYPASEDDSPLFRSDDFRIWCMKVIPCTKRFVHDWTVCPFAHAGEKAVRRDPRTHNYTGIACPDMKKQSSCIRGDKCPYAHNVFEYWLHPTRYRTQLCNDGPTCKRSICFFAHSLEELRVPAVKPYVSPEALARASLEAIQQNPHPLGQQLPNPAAAMRAASAPLAAGGTPRSSANSMMAPPYSPHAPPRGAAGPFGFAPGSVPQQGGMGGYAAYPGTGPYGAAPPPASQQFPPVRMSAPGSGRAASMDYGAGAARRMSLEKVKLSLTPAQAPGWGADAMGGFPASPAAPPPAGWAGTDFSSSSGSSLPSSLGTPGFPGAGGSLTAPPSLRPSFDTAAYPAGPPASAGYAATAGRLSSSSAAAAAGVLGRDRSNDSLSCLDQVVRPSYGSDGGSDRVGSPGEPLSTEGPSTSGSAGALPATTELDLAQSLATLKIALTQQHVAAAAGSNHEIVISTLHQILKDAIAQHGGKMPNLSLPGQQPGSPHEGIPAAGAPALAASSALYAPSSADALAGHSASPLPVVRGSGGAGAAQQPWISTMGNIQWDSPTAAGAAGEHRVSAENNGAE